MTQCVHHWVIDSKNQGACRNCGEGKQFPTLQEVFGETLAGNPWRNNRPLKPKEERRNMSDVEASTTDARPTERDVGGRHRRNRPLKKRELAQIITYLKEHPREPPSSVGRKFNRSKTCIYELTRKYDLARTSRKTHPAPEQGAVKDETSLKQGAVAAIPVRTNGLPEPITLLLEILKIEGASWSEDEKIHWDDLFLVLIDRFYPSNLEAIKKD